jgi:hypothetical protein
MCTCWVIFVESTSRQALLIILRTCHKWTMTLRTYHSTPSHLPPLLRLLRSCLLRSRVPSPTHPHSVHALPFHCLIPGYHDCHCRCKNACCSFWHAFRGWSGFAGAINTFRSGSGNWGWRIPPHIAPPGPTCLICLVYPYWAKVVNPNYFEKARTYTGENCAAHCNQAWHPYLRHRYCIAIPRY